MFGWGRFRFVKSYLESHARFRWRRGVHSVVVSLKKTKLLDYNKISNNIQTNKGWGGIRTTSTA